MNDENQPAGSPTASPEFAGVKQSKLSSTDRKTIQPSAEFAKSVEDKQAADPSVLNPAAAAQIPSTGLTMPDQTALSEPPAIQTQPEPAPIVAAPAAVAPPIAEPATLPTREDHGEATIQPLPHEPTHTLDTSMDSTGSSSAATVSTITEPTPATNTAQPSTQPGPTNDPQAVPAKAPSFLGKLLNMFKRK